MHGTTLIGPNGALGAPADSTAACERIAPVRMGRSFGNRVRSARLTAQQSQAQTAALCSITVGYLARIERGRRLPSPPVALAIASALGCPSLLRSYFRTREARRRA